MSDDTGAGGLTLNRTNIAFLAGTSLIALIGAPWYVWTRGLGLPEVLTCCGLWVVVGISLSAGYHRLFSHKAYETVWAVRLVFLIFGAGAIEDAVFKWAADHRLHHFAVDAERDPYNIQKGFWWAHVGWVLFDADPPPLTLVRDLLEDPLVRWQARWYKVLAGAVTFGIPLAVGLATGRVLGCLLFGGIVRVVATHQTTFFINSFCHAIGRRPFSHEHSARDNGVMALITFGEAYHNYHHSFPFDYRIGIKAWQFDPGKWTIYVLSRMGLATGLRTASAAAILDARAACSSQHNDDYREERSCSEVA